jgi:hypothetical protein
MAYDYVRRTYNVNPVVGRRVTHTVTNKSGIIAREDKGAGHYVQVRFDGQRHALPCHPTELIDASEPYDRDGYTSGSDGW